MPLHILSTLWLFFPAFVANAIPVIAAHVPGLRHWNALVHPGLFGTHKTWRGIVSGIVIAMIVAATQAALHIVPLPEGVEELHATLQHALLTGFLLGAGALGGDLFKSFCKRRTGLCAGESWPIIDGIDYVLGAIVLLAPLYVPSLPSFIVLILISPVASLLANSFSYAVGWKKVWH